MGLYQYSNIDTRLSVYVASIYDSNISVIAIIDTSFKITNSDTDIFSIEHKKLMLII